jgi:hypothetical protein
LISVVTGAQPISSPDVITDLAHRGFGLSGLIGGNIRRDFYFDKTWQDIRLESCCTWGGVEIATDGTLVGGNGKELVILNPQGRRQEGFPEPALTSQITWNRQTGSLAIVALDRSTKQLVLEYGSLGSKHFEVVERVKSQNTKAPMETISWSPDASAIAYSSANKILIYGVRDREAHSIADGTNPSWSPNGGQIAYRDKNGNAAVFNLGDRSVRILMPDIQIRWGVRWSPDSEYVLVTTLRPRAGLHDESDFLIYRMRDGKTARIDPLVGGTTEDRVFWIVKQK